MLTILSQLRASHRLPFELLQLIDNTVHACKPAEQAAAMFDDRAPMHR